MLRRQAIELRTLDVHHNGKHIWPWIQFADISGVVDHDPKFAYLLEKKTLLEFLKQGDIHLFG